MLQTSVRFRTKRNANAIRSYMRSHYVGNTNQNQNQIYVKFKSSRINYTVISMAYTRPEPWLVGLTGRVMPQPRLKIVAGHQPKALARMLFVNEDLFQELNFALSPMPLAFLRTRFATALTKAHHPCPCQPGLISRFTTTRQSI